MEHSKKRTKTSAQHGEKNPNCRVTDEDVWLMIQLRENHGFSPRQLQAKFDDYDPPIGITTIKEILSGKKRGRRG